MSDWNDEETTGVSMPEHSTEITTEQYVRWFGELNMTERQLREQNSKLLEKLQMIATQMSQLQGQVSATADMADLNAQLDDRNRIIAEQAETIARHNETIKQKDVAMIDMSTQLANLSGYKSDTIDQINMKEDELKGLRAEISQLVEISMTMQREYDMQRMELDATVQRCADLENELLIKRGNAEAATRKCAEIKNQKAAQRITPEVPPVQPSPKASSPNTASKASPSTARKKK